ncbi:MAG: DUF308 domain-containing protein [Bacteroides sp.]|nr:DUF308 domain-containing protein [Bacteroides sp.]MCM1412984.1 DUF308 domain-containing protein [Bacteroides sp.]MCM1471690.1 DUF308 domain-containing protein [Bacteroides sp.]
MKNRFNDWPVILIAAAVGVLFIVWHNKVELFSWLVCAIGILLLIPGIWVLVHALRVSGGSETATIEVNGRNETGRGSAISMFIVAGATIIVGLWMLINPGFFVGLIVYLFAVALLLYGIYQFAVLIYFTRPAVMPWYFYIIPSIFVIAGIVILMTSVKDIQSTVTLLTGILLVAGAANSLISEVVGRSQSRRLLLQEGNHDDDTVHAESK